MSTGELKQWFDRLLEQPASLRWTALADMPIEAPMRERLGGMLLFDEASRLHGDAREAALTRSEVPAPLRERVRAMLEKDHNVREAQRAGAAALARQLRDKLGERLAETLVGTSIGSFRLVSLIGQGGSSAVFRAVRSAGDGSQVVALKLLRTGLYSEDAQRRFRREQAILARLTHAHIATLIEGGVSAAGVPYIAMELVEGQPITQAANARALGVHARLAWFATLCRTIEAAHEALIMHRDLKPSNLYVTHEGVLKVLDFGIAKAVEEETEATRTQSIALTPGYAAPEQFRTGALTTAVDVYSLGVVLGELLTGERLSAARRASQAVLARPALPTGLPVAPVLARRLRGDLDAILASALAEEPTQRYRSAAALADDVERYLAGKPVRAHPPSRAYRTRKFVARHRKAIAAGSVLLAAILVSVGTAIWQGFAAQRAADHASAQAARAESMRNFIFDVFAQAVPAKPHNGPITVDEVVRQAIAKTRNDSSIDPRARLELLQRLGEVVGGQGDLEASSALLENLRGQAAELVGADDPLTLDIERSVEYVHDLRGDYTRARAEVDRLLARIPPALVELRVSALRDSADIATHLGEEAAALSTMREAVAIARRSGNSDVLRDALEDLGVALGANGDDAAAIPVFQEVLGLVRSRFGADSDRAAAVLGDLSRAYRRTGDLANAEQSARAALTIDRTIYPGDHWVTANHLNALGQVLVAKRELGEALATYAEGERIGEATLGVTHPTTATDLQALAFVEMQLDDFAAALPHLHTALEGKSASLGANGWEAAFVRSDYGYAMAMTGDVRGGIKQMEQATRDLRALAQPQPHALARSLEKRIRFALDHADPVTAVLLIDELATVSARARGQAAYWTGRAECLRGEISLAQHRADAAVTHLRACGDALAGAPSPDPQMRVEQRLLIAVAARQALPADADALAAEARAALHALTYPPARLRALERKLPAAPAPMDPAR